MLNRSKNKLSSPHATAFDQEAGVIHLASAGYDHTIRFWSPHDGKCSPAAERDFAKASLNIRSANEQANSNLLLLQKEIKEEEDEIFADINSLINRSESDDYLDQSYETLNATDRTSNSVQPDESQYLSQHEPQDTNPESENDPPNQYLDDYGIANFNRNEQNDYQNIQAIIKQVTSNLPKPCVFFLEGNCRRSDCKYSHDLSNIPCKYWIEGFCFKGEMCPFLHSYNLPGDGQNSDCTDEDGLTPSSKKQLNPTFVIDSDADFPALPLDSPATITNDNAKSGITHDPMATTIRNQILSSNAAVVFKTVKKKRKRG